MKPIIKISCVLFLFVFVLPFRMVSQPIPSNLSCTYENENIILHWDTYPVTNLYKINIYRETQSPASVLIDSVMGAPIDTFYVDSVLTKEYTYYYRITAVDSSGSESGFSNEIHYDYFFKPQMHNIAVNSLHWGNNMGDEDMGVETYIWVNDPQGLGDIDSVKVKYPDNSNHELYDDGQHSDNGANDGEYCLDNWDISGYPELGVYTFTISDKSGNITEITDTLKNNIDYPHNVSPIYNSVTDVATPTFTWDIVDGATGYSVWVNNKDNQNVWSSPTFTTNSVQYNYNGTGQSLVDGERYSWGVDAYLDEAHSWNHWNYFFYSSNSNNPVYNNIELHSRHYGDDQGNEEYGYMINIEIGDPQGLSDIDKVTVTSPSNVVYNLYDDGQHSDDYANDGKFSNHFGGLTQPPPIGNYLFTITDKSFDTIKANDYLDTVIDYPRNLIPANNEVINTVNPKFRWSKIQGADHYSINVWEQNQNCCLWSIGIGDRDSVVYNENGTGVDLFQDKVYMWNIYTDVKDAESWNNGNVFIYSPAPEKPAIVKPQLQSKKYINNDGSYDTGLEFNTNVYDPQGLNDIKSVQLFSPFGSTFEMYDDGQHSDEGANDGYYARQIWGLSSVNLQGAYSLIAKDNSGNDSVIVLNLDKVLEVPQNQQPVNNSVISTATPTFSWDAVTGADYYQLAVFDQNKNRIWGWVNITGSTSVVYNFDGNGTALSNNSMYYWQVQASSSQGSSWRESYRFVYSSELTKPIIVSQKVQSMHYASPNGSEDYGFSLKTNVFDPQGLNDIKSVVVTTPDNELITLNFNENDGAFEGDFWNYSSLKTGTYTFSATDNSGNITTGTDVLDYVIDLPKVISPVVNGVVAGATPVFQWETVPGATSYSMRVWLDGYGDVWGWINTTENQVTYNYNSQGQDLHDGNMYGWELRATVDDASSWVSPLKFAYSTDANKPVFGNYGLSVQNSISYLNNPNYGYDFWIDVTDPQGLSDIDQVWVETPSGENYTLYDDNTHCDDVAGDGNYRFCNWPNQRPQAGNYTFNVRDKSGNTNSKISTVDVILDCPVIKSPINDGTVQNKDFKIEWEKLPGATSYTAYVEVGDGSNIWSYGIDSSFSSVNYNGPDLVEGQVYKLNLFANSLNFWSHTEVIFTYQTNPLIIVDGNKDSFWETATGHIHIDASNLVWSESDYDNDCSADVYLAYDNYFLYGFVEVNDDVMGDKYDWWWDNDAFKILLDNDPFTLASDKNASDVVRIEYTARSDADDPRNGPGSNMFVRNIKPGGYTLEFAIPAGKLINTSPDPDEPFNLTENYKAGFLFGLADEDDTLNTRGREAEFYWGNETVNQNSENNLSNYGNITLLANNQVEISHKNLLMDDNSPFIASHRLSLQHYLSDGDHERWTYKFYLELNDPQGLSDIDSVWVTYPDNSIHLLSDDGNSCDGYKNDGNYGWCTGGDVEPPFGYYTFHAIDKSGNLVSATDSINFILSIPEITSIQNNEFVSDQNFSIDWNLVSGATSYTVEVDDLNQGRVWNVDLDSDQSSVLYNFDSNGQPLENGVIYQVILYANLDNIQSSTILRFAYAPSALVTIDAAKDAFWDSQIGHIHIDTSNMIWCLEGYTKDLYADLYVAYDSLFMYGFISVNDSILGDRQDWWWDNDAFKLIFDTDPLTLAMHNNYDDRLFVEYTALEDLDDRRNGPYASLYSRWHDAKRYTVEFAIPAYSLINYNVQPNEKVLLQPGYQGGFLFELADEDDTNNQRGRDADYAWGNITATSGFDENLTQYGKMTFQDNHNIEFSKQNLILPPQDPYILDASLNFCHYLDEEGNEVYNFDLNLTANDAQGLSDIDSVWVEFPNGENYLLYDDGNYCDNTPGDGYYRHCFNYNKSVPLGYYTFYVRDKSGHQAQYLDSINQVFDYPDIISPVNNSIVTNQDFLIKWNSPVGVGAHWINLAWVDEDNNSYWFWSNYIPENPGLDSITYSGGELTVGDVYLLDISNEQTYAKVKFTFRENDRKIIYVNDSSQLSISDGSKDYPYKTIQTGIISSINGDTVLVYPGTYYENININSRDIVLTSRFIESQDTNFIYNTVIDGGGNGSDITANNTENMVINGFTITGGYSDNGGGIQLNDVKGQLSNLIVTENDADKGGGLGINQSEVVISNSIIENNLSSNEGGGITIWGDKLTLLNSQLRNNRSGGEGPALRAYTEDVTIKNSLIADNSGSYAICTSDATIINSTVANNSGGGLKTDNAPMIRNSIIYASPGTFTRADVKYSIVQTLSTGEGNINSDPLFTDSDKGNYHLQPISPAINSGMADTANFGLGDFDLDNNPRISYSTIDMGAYESTGTLTKFLPQITDAGGSNLSGVNIKVYSKNNLVYESNNSDEIFLAPGTYTIRFSLPGYFCRSFFDRYISGVNDNLNCSLGIIGDYNVDGQLNGNDIADFIDAWNNKDITIEFGPVNGTSPVNYVVEPDDQLDFEDFMVFAKVWNDTKQKSIDINELEQKFKITGGATVKLDADHEDTYSVLVDKVSDYKFSHILIQLPEGVVIKEITRGEVFKNKNVIELNYNHSSENIYEVNLGVLSDYVDFSNSNLINFTVRTSGMVVPDKDPIIYYDIRQKSGKISTGITKPDIPGITSEFILSQNFPNPVLGAITKITLNLPEDQHVLLKVYDVNGKLAMTLLNQFITIGKHTIDWNTSGLDPGIYYYCLTSNNYSAQRKCIILK